MIVPTDLLRLAAGAGWWPIATGVLLSACGIAAVWRRDPLAWIGPVGLVFAAAVVVIARAVVLQAPDVFAAIGLIKPSGHAALAATAYGVIGLIYLRDLPAMPRAALRLVCVGLMVAAPAAMVALGLHTIPDIAVGAIGGLIPLLLSLRVARTRVVPAER